MTTLHVEAEILYFKTVDEADDYAESMVMSGAWFHQDVDLPDLVKDLFLLFLGPGTLLNQSGSQVPSNLPHRMCQNSACGAGNVIVLF